MKTSALFVGCMFFVAGIVSCRSSQKNMEGFSVDNELDYCRSQAELTLFRPAFGRQDSQFYRQRKHGVELRFVGFMDLRVLAGHIMVSV